MASASRTVWMRAPSSPTAVTSTKTLANTSWEESQRENQSGGDRGNGRMRNENERARQGWAVGGACLEGHEEERVEQVQVAVPAVHRGEVPVDLHHGGLRVPRQRHHGCDDGEASQSEGKAWGKGRRQVRAGVPVRSVRCR